jgi:hypothetical protein
MARYAHIVGNLRTLNPMDKAGSGAAQRAAAARADPAAGTRGGCEPQTVRAEEVSMMVRQAFKARSKRPAAG